MKKIPSFFIAFFAGGLYALAYPSFLGSGFFGLIFLAIPLFFYLLNKEQKLVKRILVALGFNSGLNVIGYYWIPQTLVEFGGLPYWLSFIVGLFAALILQPHWWLYTLWPKFKPKGLELNSNLGIFLSALLITILEWFIPQQFSSFAGSPWLQIAPFLGLAPIFGVSLFSFITYWVSLEIVKVMQTKKINPVVAICFGLFLISNIAMPLEKNQTGKDFKVRLVQPNIGNFMKVSSERGDRNSYQAIANLYYDLSTEDKDFQADLIIWPETAYPETFYGTETQITSLFRRILDESGSELLIGGYDQNTEKSPMDIIESVHNASLLLSEGKVKSVYHKNILIPFGETLPFGPLNEMIVGWVPAISLFAKGDGTPLMETRDGYRFITPICYEILKPSFVRSLLNTHGKNHFIVNHTNDSWYGDTAEPHQHLFLSKWRAIEFNLPLIRSTNTGITSIIYPDGSESERMNVGEEEKLDLEIKLAEAPTETIYQRFGQLAFLLVAFIIGSIEYYRTRLLK